MPSPRLIKKYANRRLYDTVESQHITLDGIRELIVAGIDVRIVDDTSGEDITRSLLLQVIADQEQGGRPLLDAELLTRLIRIYGNPMQDFVGGYLLKSVEAFTKQQRAMQSQMQKTFETLPLTAMRDLTESNLKAWKEFQDGLMGRTETDDKREDD